ncbi:hypothetical protein ACQF36_37450 [Streptomyces sp. Marseille-Q5077]|uniref:hypothetical protein n=1 Tax=Streptomyces sp. Marseille-Q5077 TaxID=3418995 RepID=UPI003D04D11B
MPSTRPDSPARRKHSPAPTCWQAKDAADARQRLSERRNDDAHLRRLDPIDLPPAVTAAFADLTLLVERSPCLADFPLWHVTETRWDTLAKRLMSGTAS